MAHVAVTAAEVTVKWFNAQKGFGFFSHDTFGDIFVHRTVLGTFQPWELQEGAPAVISFATGPKGQLQVTMIHWISLGYVKSQGDMFSLPEPLVETPAEAPVPVDVGPLKLGQSHQGVVHKVMPGYGFLKVEGVGKLLFFHYSVLPDPTVKPTVGQIFDFVLGENEKGLAATQMILVEAAVSVESVDAEVLPAADATTLVVNDVPDQVETPEPQKKRTRVRTKIDGGKSPHEDLIPPAALAAPQDGVTTLDSLAGLACLLVDPQLQPAM